MTTTRPEWMTALADWTPALLALALALGLCALIYRALLSSQAIERNRVKALIWRMRFYLRPADGFCSAAELLYHWSRFAAYWHGRRGRPGTSYIGRILRPSDSYAVRYGRAQWGRRVFGRLEDAIGCLAPPRVGKSAEIADRILRHPGPVVASSARGDLYLATVNRREWRRPDSALTGWPAVTGVLAAAATIAAASTRGGLGGLLLAAAAGLVVVTVVLAVMVFGFWCRRYPHPIEVFNPQRYSNIPSTFAWDILQACRTVLDAMRMADWLAGVHKDQGNLEWFEEKGNLALGGLLYVAALADGRGGRPLYTLRDVFLWVHSGGADRCPAVAVLNKLGLVELAQLVSRMLDSDRTAGSVRDTIDRTLQWAVVPELAAAVARGGDFDYRRLLHENGTLYLINTGEERSVITPLIRALASWMTYEAGMMASGQADQKLAVPLLLALDEVTNSCPLDLPGILQTAAGWGICVHWVAHSIAALQERWGDKGASKILRSSGVLMVMPGINDDELLESLSKLAGTRPGENNDSVMGARLISADLIRRLPDWRAMLIRLNRPIIVVRFRPYFKRFIYREPYARFSRLGPLRPTGSIDDYFSPARAMAIAFGGGYYEPAEDTEAFATVGAAALPAAADDDAAPPAFPADTIPPWSAEDRPPWPGSFKPDGNGRNGHGQAPRRR
jgi:type IV secretory system conjugative DNA transfer VirD4/TraG family protein